MKSAGIWVYVVGILMFVWGFCQLGYAFMDVDLPITIPFTEWGLFFGEEERFNDMQLGLALSCMFAAVGLLVFKNWARILTIWIIWVFAGFFFYIFLLVGPLEFEEFFIQKFALFFTMALILLWFFNQEQTRETLNSDPSKKQRRLIPFTTMLIFVVGIFVFINLPTQLTLIFKDAQFPEIQQVNYPSKSRRYYHANYERTEFPLAFSLAIPKGTTLMSMNQSLGFGESGQCDFHLDTPGRAQTLILKSQTSVQKEWASEDTQKFLNRILPLSSYSYARKIYSDRRSIMYWRSRNEIGQWGGDEIHEVNIGGMKSFVVKARKPGKLFDNAIKTYFDFNLYAKDKSAGGGQIFLFNGNEANAVHILGSMQSNLNKGKPAEEFFLQGNVQAKKNNFEDAKKSFASAVCKEMKNSSYHFGLGNMYYKTGNFEQADRHLTQSLLLLEADQEFPEAKKLLENTRKKLGKPTELQIPSQNPKEDMNAT